MKSFDILSIPIEDVEPNKVNFVFGDDSILQRLVTDRLLLKLRGCGDREDFESKSLDKIVSFIEEGSIFGPRILNIKLLGKWVKNENTFNSFTEVTQSEDFIILRSEEQAPISVGTHIECKKPSNKKAREKIIRTLMSLYDTKIFDDAVKRFSERAEDTASIESTIITLKFMVKEGFSATVADIERLLKDQKVKQDITRALLKHNLGRIVQDILNSDAPIYVLTILHSNLMKIYSWLEMHSGGVEDSKIAEILSIPPRFIKDWRGVNQYYSNRAVREVMESVANAYQAEIHSKPWTHSLIQSLQRIQ